LGLQQHEGKTNATGRAGKGEGREKEREGEREREREKEKGSGDRRRDVRDTCCPQMNLGTYR